MRTQALMIFGPSGAGKTYTVNKYPHLLIDGDYLIATTIGWPPGRWWETMSSEEKDKFAAKVDDVLVNAPPGKAVIFAPDQARTKILPHAVFLPPVEIIIRNMAAKAANGVTNQPNSEAEARKAHLNWSRYVKALGTRIDVLTDTEHVARFVMGHNGAPLYFQHY